MNKCRFAVFVLAEVGLVFAVLLWACLAHSPTTKPEYIAATAAFCGAIAFADVVIGLQAGSRPIGNPPVKARVVHALTAFLTAFGCLLLALVVMSSYFPGTMRTILGLAVAWSALVSALALAAAELSRGKRESSEAGMQDLTGEDMDTAEKGASA